MASKRRIVFLEAQVAKYKRKYEEISKRLGEGGCAHQHIDLVDCVACRGDLCTHCQENFPCLCGKPRCEECFNGSKVDKFSKCNFCEKAYCRDCMNECDECYYSICSECAPAVHCKGCDIIICSWHWIAHKREHVREWLPTYFVLALNCNLNVIESLIDLDHYLNLFVFEMRERIDKSCSLKHNLKQICLEY